MRSPSERDGSTTEMSTHLRAGADESHRDARQVLQLRAGDEILLADYGAGERGPVVLALPGWKGSDIGLRAVCAPLVRRGYRVVTVNLPGMGISPSIAGRRYDLVRLVDIVDEVVGALLPAAGPLVIVGHSFGATLAAAVASRRADDLRGLVFVSPVVIPVHSRRGVAGRLSGMSIEAAAVLLPRLPLDIGRRMIRLQAIDMLATATLARRGRRGFQRIRVASRSERTLAPDPSAVAAQMQAAARHGCLEFSGALKMPTWIIAGTADGMSTLKDLYELRNALGAHLELIPGAGHLAHHEDVHQVSGLLEQAVDVLATSHS